MKDSRGVTISSRDIIARRTPEGYRLGRASIVGFTDRSKQAPLVVCVDFDSRGGGGAWHEFFNGENLLRVCGTGEKVEGSPALVARVPELAALAQEWELQAIAKRLGSG